MLKPVLFFCWFPLQVYSQLKGKAELNRYMVNPDKPTENLTTKITIWYLGNQSIQEVPYLDSKTDSTGTHTNAYIKYYLFIDPDLHQYFYYRSFSDTSKLLKHYKGVNPIKDQGGWDLYSNKEFNYESCKKLIDTLIDANNYSRYSFRKISNGKTNDFILYTNCEIKGVPIRYLKPFSKKLGCPVTRMDIYYEGRLTGISQFQYVSYTLMNEELKVFDAWKKNEKKYLKKK